MTDEQWAKAEAVEGWYTREEAELLYELAQLGPWVEIGCYKGRSTTVLAETGQPGFAIDHFHGSPEMPDGTDTFVEFSRAMEPYPEVIVIRKPFKQAARHVPYGIRLLHLDADHSYEETREAFELYAKKLTSGSHVVFHDGRGGGWPGVEQFIEETIGQWWIPEREVGLSVALRKR